MANRVVVSSALRRELARKRVSGVGGESPVERKVCIQRVRDEQPTVPVEGQPRTSDRQLVDG